MKYKVGDPLYDDMEFEKIEEAIRVAKRTVIFNLKAKLPDCPAANVPIYYANDPQKTPIYNVVCGIRIDVI